MTSGKKLGNVRKGSSGPCLESASWTPWWHDSPYGSREVNMFWRLLPGPVIGGEAYETVPLSSEEWRAMKTQFDIKTGRTWPNLEPSERAKNTREYVLRQFWQTFVDDRLDLGNATQTKSVFFYAMAVMDKIEGWEGENWWNMLWFSPPTNLNRRCSESGTKVEKYSEVKDLAIVATFTMSFGRPHTPRMCLLRSVSAVLCRSPEINWDVNRDMKGWGLGECLFFCHMTVTVKTISLIK